MTIRFRSRPAADQLVSRSQTPPLSDIGTAGKESGGIPFLNSCQNKNPIIVTH